jgi:tetraacyldisaccharide 4'-kinase
VSGLGLLSPLYAGAVALRGRLYDAGWLRVERIDARVISVGNLVAGGSGKSPMVALIARALAGMGLPPAVVSRGYGGGYAGPCLVVSDGSGPLVGAEQAGDEPVMLASQLVGIPVIVARRRIAGAELAVARFAARCVVLDDGFQHRRLARDLDVLLLDERSPFGNGRLLPAGPLREPPEAMERAGVLVATGVAEAGETDGTALLEAAARYCPSAPVFHARTRPIDLIDVASRSSVALDRLRGARTVCFAGIANPTRFFLDAAAGGAEVAGSLRFPDHHRFGPADLKLVQRTASRARADLILTTEKDLARLAGPAGGPPSEELQTRLPGLHAMRVRMQVDEEAEFVALLKRSVS